MRYAPVGSMENWFIKRIREPTMPRPNWWSWENQWCRCNNSSSRYTRENHYAISCIKTKSFSGFQFARRITLLILPKSCGEVNAFPIAKLTNIFENECVTEKKIAAYDTSDTSWTCLSQLYKLITTFFEKNSNPSSQYGSKDTSHSPCKAYDYILLPTIRKPVSTQYKV